MGTNYRRGLGRGEYQSEHWVACRTWVPRGPALLQCVLLPLGAAKAPFFLGALTSD